jgi:hypothetical protein
VRPLAVALAAQEVTGRTFGDHRRRQNVFQRGQLRQEMVKLKNHAEIAIAQHVA